MSLRAVAESCAGAATERAPASALPHDPFAAALEERRGANLTFFEQEAERIAELCFEIARRCARGGRLLAAGLGAQARSDARHVAVEFVHPVIVGKRALPALALTAEGGSPAAQLELLGRPDDVVLAFGCDGASEANADLRGALARAERTGRLVVRFGGADPRARWSFAPPSSDPFVRQELTETLYHVVWELVHVFFEHPGLLGGARGAALPDPGASRFLYPFLKRDEADADAVLTDVATSVRAKARDVAGLRDRTVLGGCGALVRACALVRERLRGGATLLAFGNGGSATDCMDLVADLRTPPSGARPSAAIDLTEDTSILTAIGNDVGMDAVFSRQIIAYGRPGDVALAFSTSGGSRNVLRALEESRRRGLATVAIVGYDGGPIARDGLADVVVVAPSEYIPRIQEAQATVYHFLCDAVQRSDEVPA